MTREKAIAGLNRMLNDEYLNETYNVPIRSIDMAIEALQPWVRTADRVPEKEDADVWGMVLATHRPFGGEPFKVRYPCVRNRPFDHVWWMPIPPLPEGDMT